jgi:hypothetical protein
MGNRAKESTKVERIAARRRDHSRAWLDLLAPEDRERAQRWCAEPGGEEAFERILRARLQLRKRAIGRPPTDDGRLVREMISLLWNNPTKTKHWLAREVSRSVISKGDWRGRATVAEKTLTAKLTKDFAAVVSGRQGCWVSPLPDLRLPADTSDAKDSVRFHFDFGSLRSDDQSDTVSVMGIICCLPKQPNSIARRPRRLRDGRP